MVTEQQEGHELRRVGQEDTRRHLENVLRSSKAEGWKKIQQISSTKHQGRNKQASPISTIQSDNRHHIRHGIHASKQGHQSNDEAKPSGLKQPTFLFVFSQIFQDS